LNQWKTSSTWKWNENKILQSLILFSNTIYVPSKIQFNFVFQL